MMTKSFIINEIRLARPKQVSCIGEYYNSRGVISRVGKDRYNPKTNSYIYNENYEITVIGSMINCPSGYISIVGKTNDQSSIPTIPEAYEIASYIGNHIND